MLRMFIREEAHALGFFQLPLVGPEENLQAIPAASMVLWQLPPVGREDHLVGMVVVQLLS